MRLHPIPHDVVPGVTTGAPTLGQLRQQADGDKVVITNPRTGLKCSATLAEWSALSDETEMGVGFRYSVLPRWLRPLR